jgi:hypothetical protein
MSRRRSFSKFSNLSVSIRILSSSSSFRFLASNAAFTAALTGFFAGPFFESFSKLRENCYLFLLLFQFWKCPVQPIIFLLPLFFFVPPLFSVFL